MDLANAVAQDPRLKQALARISVAPLVRTPVLFAKIKLLWACNLNCRFCARPQNGFMRRETAQTILRELREHGLQKVHFSGGELLLHPDIRDILADATHLGLQVNLSTNGTLIDRETARQLARLRIHAVSVSLDGAQAKTHDRLRRQKGAFKSALNGIANLLRYRKKYPRIRVNTVITQENFSELQGIHQMLTQMDPGLIWKLIPVDSPKARLRLNRDQAEILAEQARDWQLLQEPPLPRKKRAYKDFAKGRYAGDYYRLHPCYIPWLHLFIDPLGFVYPCCMTRSQIPALGRLGEQTVAAVLAGERIQAVRLAISRGQPFEICHCCDDFLFENRSLYDSMENQGLL